MRSFTKKDRMQADSLPEIRRALEHMAFQYRDQRVGNRPASEGHILNAAILILMAMPEAERERSAREALRWLDSLLSVDDPTARDVAAILVGPETKDPAEMGAGSGGDPVVTSAGDAPGVVPAVARRGRSPKGKGNGAG
jgi:hypothetical protein